MNLNVDFVVPSDAQKIKTASSKPLFSTEALTIPVYLNGVILPGGWQNSYGGVCQDQAQEEQHRLHAQCLAESVVYVGEFLPTWGHLITDLLRHFWYLIAPDYAHLKTLRIAYTMHFEQDEIPENFYSLMQCLGVEKTQFLRINRITSFEKIYFPDGCYRVRNVLDYFIYTQEYVDLINHIAQFGKKQEGFEKVYFSRTQIAQQTKFYHRRDVNEQAIEKVFKNQGFKIIYPENLSFLAQLNILQSCQTFAATDGSVMHNLLFCKTGVNAIVVRKSRHFTLHQITINHLKNANVFYVDCGFSPFADQKAHWWAGPFFMYVSPNLRKMFCLSFQFFPIFSFLFSYCLAEFLRNILDNRLLIHIRKKLKIGQRLKKLFK